jgi:hypothetical protein
MMTGNLAIASITNTPISPPRSGFASLQTDASEVTPLQSAMEVGEIADQGTVNRSPSSSTTQSVIFDPTSLEMIYEETDARTDQVLGRVPMGNAAATARYAQNQVTAGSPQRFYTIV